MCHNMLCRRIQTHVILNESQSIKLALEKEENLSPLLKQCLSLSYELCEGNYLSALISAWNDDNGFIKLVDLSASCSIQTKYDRLEQCLTFYLSENDHSEELLLERSWFVMLCGALCLNIFVQSNWVGPPIENLHSTPFDNVTDNEEQIQKYAIQKLSIGGELAYSKTVAPHYLVLAKTFLERKQLRKFIKILDTCNWWALRASIIHQQILTHNVQILKDQCFAYFETLLPRFGSSDVKAGELAARLYLEHGLMCHMFGQSKSARESFQNAKKATKLFTKLTGTLGVRTKFQTEKIAQLVLIAKSRKMKEVSTESIDEKLPEEVPLEEDNELLPRMELDACDSDSEDELNENEMDNSLRIIDQSILLCMCIDIKNNNAKDGLTTEEMFPYVNKVQEEPKNWMVYSTCLLLKSRLENERTRTAERSVLQLQVLAEQFNDTEPGVSIRMNFLYNLPFPPLFELNRELGDRFLSVGAAMSALQIYEKLEMWDEIIKCYLVMDKENRAKKITLKRIKQDPTNPLLWCILGDLKQGEKNRKAIKIDEIYKEFELDNVVDYYDRAWSVSELRFSRAKRSIGNYLVKNEKFEEAIEPFDQALAINPLYPATWFTLGCCCMRVGKWGKALNAFTRAVQIEPDDGECWSNLASCHLRVGNKEKAYSALQIALKHKYESWRIWENYLVVSIDLQEYQNACLAIDRLVELKIDKDIDFKILTLIIKAFYQIASYNMAFSNPLKEKIEKTLEKVASRISMNPEVWSAYSMFYEVLARLTNNSNEPEQQKQSIEYMQRVVQMNEKYLRTLQIAGWDKEIGKFQLVCSGAMKLVSSYLRLVDALRELANSVEIKDPYYNARYYTSQAVICLKTIINRAANEEHLASSKEYTHLRQILSSIEQSEQ
jgi:tetratricopeptide (TPR) repeat protein